MSPDPAERCEHFLTELLQAIDGIDAQAIARDLIDQFGSLQDTLASSALAQMRVCSDIRVVRLLRAVRGAATWMQRRNGIERRSLGSYLEAAEYLRLSLGMEAREQVRLLLLDNRMRLIRDDLLALGGPSQAEISVRDVLTRGVEAGAAAMILVHNHPSGDPRPSMSDVGITERINAVAKAMEMKVVDHIIVTRTECTSLRTLGVLR